MADPVIIRSVRTPINWPRSLARENGVWVELKLAEDRGGEVNPRVRDGSSDSGLAGVRR